MNDSGIPEIGGGPGGPPQQQLNIDPSTLDSVECEECGCTAFTEAVVLKRVSALQSPRGKPGVIPMQTFACVSCGNVNDEFNPAKRGDINE
jgi:hypothetical protein